MIEDHLPGPLQWRNVGDPASWLIHFLVAGAIRFGVGFLAGDEIGRSVAFGFYAIREGLQALHHFGGPMPAFEWRVVQPDTWRWWRRVYVGWAGDGLGDMAGPTFWLLF